MKKEKKKTKQTKVVGDIKIDSFQPISQVLHGPRSKYRPVALKMEPGDSVSFRAKGSAQALRAVLCRMYGVGCALSRNMGDGSYRVWRIQ
jgi:hypothetical protein